MTDYDELQLKNIFAPQCVGVPPINAGFDLMVMPDGEIRHYAGYHEIHVPKENICLSSRDNGLSWKMMPAADGCPGGMTYVPFSGKWIRLQGTKDGLTFFEADSMDGPFRSHVIRPANAICIRLPMVLQGKKNRLLACGQETLPGKEDSIATVYFSDDCGVNWRTVYFDQIPPYQQKEYDHGARWDICGAEPTIAELSDGTLYMLIRTSQDRYYQSFSHDSGETWTQPNPSPFYGTATNPTLFRMKSGRLLFFGNLTRPMPELKRDNVSYLSESEKRGRWEDLFTNRDVLHAALSDDDGETWHGFREIWLNPMRNDSNFRLTGGWGDSNDKSVHQEQAVELPYGKILLALGQHPTMRKMILFDPDWLLQKEREDDFLAGTDNWSTHLYLKGRLGGTRGPGTGHCCWNRQQGAGMVFREEFGMRDLLQVARYADPRLFEERQGAVWNFPSGTEGEIRLEWIPRTGMKGTRFMLMDHWANPGDASAVKQACWTFSLTADGLISGEAVKMDEINTLLLCWKDGQACFSLNGGERRAVPLTAKPLNGINYLHVQSSAETEDQQGIFLRYVKAVVR